MSVRILHQRSVGLLLHIFLQHFEMTCCTVIHTL